jgi:hypothetical protein
MHLTRDGDSIHHLVAVVVVVVVVVAGVFSIIFGFLSGDEDVSQSKQFSAAMPGL